MTEVFGGMFTPPTPNYFGQTSSITNVEFHLYGGDPILSQTLTVIASDGRVQITSISYSVVIVNTASLSGDEYVNVVVRFGSELISTYKFAIADIGIFTDRNLLKDVLLPTMKILDRNVPITMVISVDGLTNLPQEKVFISAVLNASGTYI